MPRQERSRTGERGGRPELSNEAGRLLANLVEITRTARIDPKRYQDVVNSHGSALEQKIARYQQVYDEAQTFLDDANQRVGTLQGEEKEKLKREMHSCNTRKTAQRIEVEKACRQFVSDMSAIEQDLKTRFPALKDRDLKAGILSKEDVAKAVAT